jgi:hypothetical protein
MLGIGFLPGRVLTFGSVRGSNALADVECLHIVGRPWPPQNELLYVAQVIHHDEPPVSAEVVLREVAYGGQPYAITVYDYADNRVAALLKGSRDDELVQVIHRARLLTLQPQIRLGRSDGRIGAALVLHTSHPLPGLRITELVLPDDDGLTLNQQRAADAEARIGRAMRELLVEGAAPTIAALARRARADRRTVTKVLGTGRLRQNRANAACRPMFAGTTMTWERCGDPLRIFLKGLHIFPIFRRAAEPGHPHRTRPIQPVRPREG